MEVKLSEISSRAPKGVKKKATREEFKVLGEELSDLHHTLYAQGKHSLLVVMQGMDASGKDGSTRSVFSHCSPEGINTFAFKKPSSREMAHDFLWRIHQHAPQKGMVQVFNRSHYEDILIQRVHEWIPMEKVESRMRSINAWERLLQEDNGTVVLKFYLHISNKKQEEKLQERIDNPRKHWKHNPADWTERSYWNEYREAYEYAMNNSEIPWIIVPADQRWYRNYVVMKHVVEAMRKMDLELPQLSML